MKPRIGSVLACKDVVIGPPTLRLRRPSAGAATGASIAGSGEKGTSVPHGRSGPRCLRVAQTLNDYWGRRWMCRWEGPSQGGIEERRQAAGQPGRLQSLPMSER